MRNEGRTLNTTSKEGRYYTSISRISNNPMAAATFASLGFDTSHFRIRRKPSNLTPDTLQRMGCLECRRTNNCTCRSWPRDQDALDQFCATVKLPQPRSGMPLDIVKLEQAADLTLPLVDSAGQSAYHVNRCGWCRA